jgi:molybdenum cofactor cytidylyltransferase
VRRVSGERSGVTEGTGTRRQGPGAKQRPGASRGPEAPAAGPVAVVVLAAGGSSRLGTPKQLVRWRGRTLLRRAAETAVAAAERTVPEKPGRAGTRRAHSAPDRRPVAPRGPVVVVLGAGARTLRAELAGLPVHVAVNRRWREGLASSLRAGVRAARPASGREGPAAILFLTCDQPHVTPSLLRRLVRRFRQGSSLVACAYAGTLGVPALFAAEHFGGLLALTGDQGARRLLARQRGAVAAVPFVRGAVDVDRADDVSRLPRRPDARNPNRRLARRRLES